MNRPSDATLERRWGWRYHLPGTCPSRFELSLTSTRWPARAGRILAAPMKRATETDPIAMDDLRQLARARFGDMVKAVVDLRRAVMLVDAEMHADQEAELLGEGSAQRDLWGINLYPDMAEADWLEFDAMINLRPSFGNRSRGVDHDAGRPTSAPVAWAASRNRESSRSPGGFFRRAQSIRVDWSFAAEVLRRVRAGRSEAVIRATPQQCPIGMADGSRAGGSQLSWVDRTGRPVSTRRVE